MAEPTIASAVAIPEPDQLPSPPFPKSTLKRRQSSVSSPDSKRPRLSTDTNAAVQDDTSELPSATSPSRPSERRRGGAAEERTRNKRLFGGLLGHLAQASPSSAQRRRADIEQKQQAKLKLQAEEREEEKRKKREELLVVRRREQRAYDKQAMQTRHANLLNIAQFLKTKCEPVLYYKPWDLQPTEEEWIKSQIEEAQTAIDRELKEFAERMGSDDEAALNPTQQEPSLTRDQAADGGPSGDPDTVGSKTNNDAATEPLKDNPANSPFVPPSETIHEQPEPMKGQEDEHSGEVMEEGQEDTVIY